MNGFFAAGQWWDVTTNDSDAIKGGAERLAVAGIENGLAEARMLWAAAMPKRYEDYGDIADGTMMDRYIALLDRRAARVPISHLLGYRDFYKHRFYVTADVLDPRPDTETLIETALTGTFTRVLDLGTGSGCILLSLLAERPEATGVGTDLSEAALGVAARNVARLELGHAATLTQSNWFESVEGAFDLIVSNPPYIAAAEMTDLQPEVRDHEPRMALTDEDDGLSCYRAITSGAMGYLTPNGHLMFEIGPSQAAAVSAMMIAQGFAEIRVMQDLDGRDRVVSGQKIAS